MKKTKHFTRNVATNHGGLAAYYKALPHTV